MCVYYEGTEKYSENKNGETQTTILTPFFGQGQISINDIEVISTWINI